MRTIALLVGDVFVLYLGLFLALILRYQTNFYGALAEEHLTPFTIIFILWILVFYVAGLYDIRKLRNNIGFFKNLFLTILINALLAVAFFYFIPVFGITPKTNLFIFLFIFAVLETIWRRYFNSVAYSAEPMARAVLVGKDNFTKEISNFIIQNPQLGYEIISQTGEFDLLVIPHALKKEPELAKTFYELLASGTEIKDLPSFYEIIFRRTPLPAIGEEWLIENVNGQKRFYDGIKRGAEILLASILILILLPLMFLIAVLIKIFSPGPAVYKQTRIGQGGKEFTLYKFRTMRTNAETNGPQWAKESDERVTAVGRFMRYTHLDELPQLLNILKGDLSFVGPRPERPEFVKILREKIPYYEIRHLIKPGITGWAQINYRYGASVEDAYKKMEYDIYYLKNRSLILDLAIVLKTIKSFFVNPK